MAQDVIGHGRAVVIRQKFFWPDAALNWWTLVMLVAGSLILGVFAEFMSIQSTMRLATPWLFPYGVTVGSLTLFFILIELILIGQRRLFPGVMIVGAFILLVLYLAGLVETAIQLFGPANINSQCQMFVDSDKSFGPSIDTLAWLQQNNICSCWRAAFAFWIIGVVFLVWMMVMAFQVSRGDFES